jgi:hypothetical protein
LGTLIDAVFGNYPLVKYLNEDAPSCPRVADFTSTQRTLVNPQQLFNNVLHSEQVKHLAALTRYRSSHYFFVDQ